MSTTPGVRRQEERCTRAEVDAALLPGCSENAEPRSPASCTTLATTPLPSPASPVRTIRVAWSRTPEACRQVWLASLPPRVAGVCLDTTGLESGHSAGQLVAAAVRQHCAQLVSGGAFAGGLGDTEVHRDLTQLSARAEELGGVPQVSGFVRAFQSSHSGPLVSRLATAAGATWRMLCIHARVLPPPALSHAVTFCTPCTVVDLGGHEVVMAMFGDGLLPRPEDAGVCPTAWYKKQTDRDLPTLLLHDRTCNAVLVARRVQDCLQLRERYIEDRTASLETQIGIAIFLLYTALCMTYTHDDLWPKVFGGMVTCGVHARKWRKHTACRLAGWDIDPQLVMYGDCPSLAVTNTCAWGSNKNGIVNWAQLEMWLFQEACHHLEHAGRLERVSGGRGKTERPSWRVVLPDADAAQEVVSKSEELMASSVELEGLALTRQQLRLATAPAWTELVSAIHPDTLYVLDSEGNGDTHCQVACMDVRLRSVCIRNPQLCSPLLALPMLVLGVLVTEDAARKHEGDTRGVIALHELHLPDHAPRLVLACHKVKGGGDGHMQRFGLARMWRENTVAGMRADVALHAAAFKTRNRGEPLEEYLPQMIANECLKAQLPDGSTLRVGDLRSLRAAHIGIWLVDRLNSLLVDVRGASKVKLRKRPAVGIQKRK